MKKCVNTLIGFSSATLITAKDTGNNSERKLEQNLIKKWQEIYQKQSETSVQSTTNRFSQKFNSDMTTIHSIALQRYIPKYFLFSVRLNLASSYKQLNNKNKHTYRLVGYQTIIISLQPVTELFSKIKHSRNITKSVTVTCTSTSSTLLLVTNKQQFRIKTSLDLEHSDELNSTVNWFCFMFQVVPDLILLFSVW